MSLVAFSEKKAENSKLGWYRAGDDISYFPNGIRKSNNSNKPYFTLRFSYTFEFDSDVVYFAYNYPYTYSRAVDLMDKLEMDTLVRAYTSRRTLCHTVSGNRCDYLTITSTKSDVEKKGICLTARVHPGETVGSWMMEGN